MDTTTTATETKPETSTSDPLTVGWGLTPPPEAVACWGARAIYTSNRNAFDANHTTRGAKKKRIVVPYFTIDTPWDRQGGAGRNADLMELQKWLNTIGLKRLTKECSEKYVTPDSDDFVEFTEGRFTLKAGPRESYGYLYIGAWVL